MFFIHPAAQRKDDLSVRCSLNLQHLPSLRTRIKHPSSGNFAQYHFEFPREILLSDPIQLAKLIAADSLQRWLSPDQWQRILPYDFQRHNPTPQHRAPFTILISLCLSGLHTLL
jgi:hypothetical protein